MKRLDRLFAAIRTHANRECLVSASSAISYGELEQRRLSWLDELERLHVEPGTVVGLRADFSPEAVSLLLALFARGCIASLVPLFASDTRDYEVDGQLEGLFDLATASEWRWHRFARVADHPLIQQLREAGGGGFSLFTSGSTGRPKAVLHAVERFLGKFQQPGKQMRTLTFLLFDHIAGMDTLFYTLASGSTLIVPDDRNPGAVCRLIERHRVEVLPVSPTFLNLLCLSHAYENHDLSSLKIVTYGSEPMSEGVLKRVREVLPHARLIQKYGTSELGSPRSRSRSSDSLWLALKTDEVEAKVADGLLWFRSDSAMLGYLNAPSPFDSEGWYCTGDRVEQDGDWIRILGRESELINVGGEKVYPPEIEAVILELECVRDVVVRGESHPLTGQIVTAQVNLARPIQLKEVSKLIRKHCRSRLEPHKVPIKVSVVDEPLVSERQKKSRS